jgi:hypothetical protein
MERPRIRKSARACLGQLGTAMGANCLNREGSPRPVSLNFSSRVMLFCLDGVTHDGKSRRNRRNKALGCALLRQINIANPLASSRGYWDIRVPTSDGKTVGLFVLVNRTGRAGCAAYQAARRGGRCCSRAGQSQCPARSPAAIRPPRTWPPTRARRSRPR